MWLCLSDAFLSIVNKAQKKGHLVVRARREGDIERIFPGYRARESRATDYRWRAEIPRRVVAETVSTIVLGIRYKNFKGSVKDKRLHDDYMRVWSVMMDAQRREEAPLRYTGGHSPRSLGFDFDTL